MLECDGYVAAICARVLGACRVAAILGLRREEILDGPHLAGVDLLDELDLANVFEFLALILPCPGDGWVNVNVTFCRVPGTADALGDVRDDATTALDGLDELLSCILVRLTHSSVLTITPSPRV